MSNEEQKEIRVSIDSEELTNTIVRAAEIVRENETMQQEETRNRKLDEWYAKIGYDRNRPSSYLGAFFRALLLKREDIEGDKATSMLLSAVSSLAMFVGMVAMFMASIGSLAGIFLIQNYVTDNLLIRRLTLVVLSLITFVFANLFRISRYEIQKSHDSDYLNTVLTTILTIVGTLITILQIFKDR